MNWSARKSKVSLGTFEKWCVYDEQDRVLVAGVSKHTATLIAAAPQMFHWIKEITERNMIDDRSDIYDARKLHIEGERLVAEVERAEL